MDAQARRDIAYIAGRLVSEKQAGSVHDYETGKWTNMSGEVSQDNVNVYDYDRKNYISGTKKSETKLSLYDYGTSNFIDLEIKRIEFEGYDYKTGNFYNGKVKGSSVSLYDYQDGKHQEYSI